MTADCTELALPCISHRRAGAPSDWVVRLHDTRVILMLSLEAGVPCGTGGIGGIGVPIARPASIVLITWLGVVGARKARGLSIAQPPQYDAILFAATKFG